MKRLSALLLLILSAPAAALELGLPAACTPGQDCFVQQFADMQPGQGMVDPWCGTATYDGHTGLDLRVLSMADVAKGVAVTAVADGTVLRGRDGVPDRLMLTEADRAKVADVECGNGIVLDLGGGYEAQYCHMKQGSVAVKPGDKVERGARLGDVGASGMAAFPHVHLTIRKDGREVDPSTGLALDAGCLKSTDDFKPLLARDVVEKLGEGESQIVASGLAGAPVDHAALAVSGPPNAADARAPAFVGWGWTINLRKDDRVRIRLTGPSGGVVAENTSLPMDRSKASWSGFAGKKGSPPKGVYVVTVQVLRGASTVAEKIRQVTID